MSFANQYLSVIKSDEGDALHSAEIRFILLRHGEEFDPECVEELESRSTVVPGEWLDVVVVISGMTQDNLGLTLEEYLSFFTNLKVEARILDKPPESELGRRPFNQQFAVVNHFQHTSGPKIFPTSMPIKSADEYTSLPAAKSPTRNHFTFNDSSDQAVALTSLPEDFYDSQDLISMKSIVNSQNDIIYQYRLAVGLPVVGYRRFLDISLTPNHPLQTGGPMSESRRRCLGTLRKYGYSVSSPETDLLSGNIETFSWVNKKHNVELRLETLNPLKITSFQFSKGHPTHFTFILQNNHPNENLVILSAKMDLYTLSGPDESGQLQTTSLQVISRNHEIPFHLSPSEQHSILFSVDAQKLGEKPVMLTSRLSCILNIRWRLPKMSHAVFSQFMVSWNYDCTSDLQTIWEAPNFATVDTEFTAKVTVSNLSTVKKYDLILQTTLPHVSGFGSVGTQIQREILQGMNAPIICLDKTIHIGELGPCASSTVEIRFLPLRRGICIPCGLSFVDRIGGLIYRTEGRLNVHIREGKNFLQACPSLARFAHHLGHLTLQGDTTSHAYAKK